jgi:hypothetical protein
VRGSRLRIPAALACGVVAHRIFLDTAAALDPQADALRARNCTRPMTRSGELAAAWQEAGFQDIAEATLTIRMDYADFEDFWRPYLGRQGRRPTTWLVLARQP